MYFKKLLTAAATLTIMAGITLLPVASNNASLFSSSTISASAAGKTIADERNKFPDGKYWNHGSKANNPNGWTSTPCYNHYECKDDGSCGCNATANWNIQCMGFADQLAYDIYGSYAQEPDPKCPNKNKYKAWTNEKLNNNSIKKIKRGDVVRDTSAPHSFMIIGVNGNSVTVAECNRDFNTCKIQWDRSVSFSELTKGCYKIYHAPYAATLGSTITPGSSTEPKPAFGTVWIENDTYIFKVDTQVYSDYTCKTKTGTIKSGSKKVIKRFFTASNGNNTIGMIDNSHFVYLRKNNDLLVRAFVTTNYSTGVNFRSSKDASTNKNIICVIPNGTRLFVTNCNSTWAQTTYNNRTGWVNLSVCKG